MQAEPPAKQVCILLGLADIGHCIGGDIEDVGRAWVKLHSAGVSRNVESIRLTG